jgi:hypothetical protein
MIQLFPSNAVRECRLSLSVLSGALDNVAAMRVGGDAVLLDQALDELREACETVEELAGSEGMPARLRGALLTASNGARALLV